ncbi:MAG TPA: class I SAM-dependent methyltransferase, partial [Gemmatimonadaceae bacterium]
MSPWATVRDVEYKSVPDAFTYVRCGACGSLSLENPPMDRLDVIYPKTSYSFGEASGFVHRIKDRLDGRWFRSMTRSLPGDRLSALDIGGGTGHQLATLRRAEPRIVRSVVVDLDEGARNAAIAGGHEYVRARIEDADVRGPFDVVLLLNLIEHVADPLAVLRRVRSLASPGAVVLVKTPNIDSLDARLFRHRNWGGYHCPRHWALFTPESFMRTARSAGFEIRSWQFTQGAPFWAVSTLALLDSLGMARIDSARPAWQHPLYAPLAAGFAAFDFLRRPLSSLSQ